MITTITNDRFYEFYGSTDDGTMGGSTILANSPLEKKRKEMLAKGIILANGSLFVQADKTGGADSKVFMWAADPNPDYPTKTSIPELGTGTWMEL